MFDTNFPEQFQMEIFLKVRPASRAGKAGGVEVQVGTETHVGVAGACMRREVGNQDKSINRQQ